MTDNSELITGLCFVRHELEKRSRGYRVNGYPVMADDYTRYEKRVAKAIQELKVQDGRIRELTETLAGKIDAPDHYILSAIAMGEVSPCQVVQAREGVRRMIEKLAELTPQ